MELMTPHSGTIFWTAVTFAILTFLLFKMAWKPILNMLEEREHRIKESLEMAEKVKEEARKTLEERKSIIDNAKNEARNIIAEGRDVAEEMQQEMLLKAKADADKMVERAKKEIEDSRDKIIQEIRDIAVDLSMTATEKLIGKSLDREDHEKLIQESLLKMENIDS